MSKKVGKLTDEQVRNVRIRLENGERAIDIANSLNIRDNIISDIKHGRTYKRVK